MSAETVLITGAASGIGLALAREFAKHGHDLILTSRVDSELDDVAAQLTSRHQIDVGTLAFDLEQPDAAKHLFDSIQR